MALTALGTVLGVRSARRRRCPRDDQRAQPGCSPADTLGYQDHLQDQPAEDRLQDDPSATPPATPAQQPQAPVSPTPVWQQPPPAQIINASAVVTQYYQDITDQNYSAAWALGVSNVSGGVGYDAWGGGLRHHRLHHP